MLSRGNLTRGDELSVKNTRRIPSAQDAVQPPRGRGDGLSLTRAEIVSRPSDADQVDPRVVRRDPLEYRERTELILLALDDERGTGHRGERGLVPRARTLRRRDRMTEDDERVGRFALGEKCAHAATERAADEGDTLVPAGAERLARGPEIVDLRGVILARPRSPRREGDRTRGDGKSVERGPELSQDGLVRAAPIAGREDRRAFHAGGFGSFCASAGDGLRRSPTASRRADIVIILEAAGRPSDAISSHRSGADTGARRMGRTLYGPAVDLARVFCR